MTQEKKRIRVAIVALVVIVLLGGVAYGSLVPTYPRLHVGDISELRISVPSSSVSGSITIEISGRGIFHLQLVSVTLDGKLLNFLESCVFILDNSCVVMYSQTFPLPQRFKFTDLTGTGPPGTSPPGAGPPPPPPSTLVVAVDGTWAPWNNKDIPMIPVHVTAQETIEWTCEPVEYPDVYTRTCRPVDI